MELRRLHHRLPANLTAISPWASANPPVRTKLLAGKSSSEVYQSGSEEPFYELHGMEPLMASPGALCCQKNGQSDDVKNTCVMSVRLHGGNKGCVCVAGRRGGQRGGVKHADASSAATQPGSDLAESSDDEEVVLENETPDSSREKGQSAGAEASANDEDSDAPAAQRRKSQVVPGYNGRSVACKNVLV